MIEKSSFVIENSTFLLGYLSCYRFAFSSNGCTVWKWYLKIKLSWNYWLELYKLSIKPGLRVPNIIGKDENGLIAMLRISTACLLLALLTSASARIFQATTNNAKNRKKHAKKTEKKTNRSMWSWSWRKKITPWEALFNSQLLEIWNRDEFEVVLTAKKNLKKSFIKNKENWFFKQRFFTLLFLNHGLIQAT